MRKFPIVDIAECRAKGPPTQRDPFPFRSCRSAHSHRAASTRRGFPRPLRCGLAAARDVEGLARPHWPRSPSRRLDNNPRVPLPHFDQLRLHQARYQPVEPAPRHAGDAAQDVVRGQDELTPTGRRAQDEKKQGQHVVAELSVVAKPLSLRDRWRLARRRHDGNCCVLCVLH